MDEPYCVYIMTNETNTVLYVGFTGDLRGRVFAHRNKLVEGFTKRYNLVKLVYYEAGDSRDGALWREKQIKAGSRQNKMDLIDRMNPKWQDLYETLGM